MGCCSHPLALACTGRGCYITLKGCYRVLHGCSKRESQQQQVQLSPLTPFRLAATPHHFFFTVTRTVWVFIRLWIHTPNGTVWHPFGLVWSSISGFRLENMSYKRSLHIRGKITTVPRLFSEHLLKNGNNHHFLNVHTKWNCLIPICPVWSSITGFRLENVTSLISDR